MADEDYTSYLCRTRGHHWSSTWRKHSGPPWEELSRCRRPGCGALAMDRVEVKTMPNGDTVPVRRFFLMVAGEHRELPTSTYSLVTTTYEVKAKALEEAPKGGTGDAPAQES